MPNSISLNGWEHSAQGARDYCEAGVLGFVGDFDLQHLGVAESDRQHLQVVEFDEEYWAEGEQLAGRAFGPRKSLVEVYVIVHQHLEGQGHFVVQVFDP